MTTFLARRNSKGNLNLLADGVRFGSLILGRDGKVVGGSFADDEVKAAFRRLRMNPNNPKAKTLKDHLWFCRRAYECVIEDQQQRADELAECAADQATELAVERWYENGGASADRIQAEDRIEQEHEANDPWLQALRDGSIYGDASGPGQDWDANGPRT